MAHAVARLGVDASHHTRVATLAVKLLLAPSFVVGASLTARRFGPRIGGLVGGLPVVAGPILLVYALTHGRAFAADAAAGSGVALLTQGLLLALATRAGASPQSCSRR